MNLLEGYLGRTVLVQTIAVMFIMLAIYFFSTLVNEMGDVGKGDYELIDALSYTAMLLPRQVYELFPVVALLGTLLGLGALANTSELTVMRAAGVSLRRIVLAVLKVGLLLALVATLLGEVVAPPLEKQANLMRLRALAENLSMNTRDGLWARDGETFINIKRLFTDGRASELRLFRFDADRSLETLVTARRGEYHGGRWQLQGVTEYRIGMGGIETRSAERMQWDSELNPGLVQLAAVAPGNLSVWDLRGYLEYMQENGLEARGYELAFWRRLAAPFVTAGMVLLAVPMVVGSMRAVSVGQRVMVGTLLGVGFYMFNGIFNQLALVYPLPTPLAALLPTIVVYLLWFVLMRRVA